MAFYSPFKLAVLCALFHAGHTQGINDNICVDDGSVNSRCWAGLDGSAYRGCKATVEVVQTNSGGKGDGDGRGPNARKQTSCQKWTSQAPHKHSRTPSNYPNLGLGDHNYCRNPDGSDRPWCYTTDRRARWKYCDVPECAINYNNCVHDGSENSRCWAGQDGKKYRGCEAVARTKGGFGSRDTFYTCQKWTSQTPHKHSRTPSNYPNLGLGDHSYCRNPDGEPHGPWCYTNDPSVRWQYCNVARCGSCMSGNTGTFKATPSANQDADR